MTDFTGIDANHDGKISQEEFDAAQEKEQREKQSAAIVNHGKKSLSL